MGSEGTHNTGHFWQGPHVLGQGCGGSGTRASRPGTGTKRSPCLAGGECTCAGLGGGQDPPPPVPKVWGKSLSPFLRTSLSRSAFLCVCLPLCLSVSVCLHLLPLSASPALSGSLALAHCLNTFFLFLSIPFPTLPSPTSLWFPVQLCVLLIFCLCFYMCLSVLGCCWFLFALCRAAAYFSSFSVSLSCRFSSLSISLAFGSSSGAPTPARFCPSSLHYGECPFFSLYNLANSYSSLKTQLRSHRPPAGAFPEPLELVSGVVPVPESSPTRA